MAGSYFDGIVPEPHRGRPPGSLAGPGEVLAGRFQAHMEALDLSAAMADLDEFVREANRRLVETAPWKLAQHQTRRADLAHEIWEALEALRLIAVLASPVMPGAAARLWEQLGIPELLASQRLPEAAAWGLLVPGTKTHKGDALFPRLEG
jgi:methionyl-tRNA synthetase